MESFENFKVLYLAQKDFKYFEICSRPVFFLYNYCVKISDLFNNRCGGYDQVTKSILSKTCFAIHFTVFS